MKTRAWRPHRRVAAGCRAHGDGSGTAAGGGEDHRPSRANHPRHPLLQPRGHRVDPIRHRGFRPPGNPELRRVHGLPPGLGGVRQRRSATNRSPPMWRAGTAAPDSSSTSDRTRRESSSTHRWRPSICSAARIASMIDDIENRAMAALPGEFEIKQWEPALGDRVELRQGGEAYVTAIGDDGTIVLQPGRRPGVVHRRQGQPRRCRSQGHRAHTMRVTGGRVAITTAQGPVQGPETPPDPRFHARTLLRRPRGHGHRRAGARSLCRNRRRRDRGPLPGRRQRGLRRGPPECGQLITDNLESLGVGRDRGS